MMPVWCRSVLIKLRWWIPTVRFYSCLIYELRGIKLFCSLISVLEIWTGKFDFVKIGFLLSRPVSRLLYSQRVASYDTSLVVSGGVDFWRRQWNVYDKKPELYAKDNRTAHLTACSDKSVACVTNSKSLLTFCTVEANYWQTRRIAQCKGVRCPPIFSLSNLINVGWL